MYLKDEDIEAFRQSTREVKIFFSYICIQIIMQSIYRLSIFIANVHDWSWDDRFLDIMLILMQIANLVMNFGISMSIKRAYSAEVKKRSKRKPKLPSISNNGQSVSDPND